MSDHVSTDHVTTHNDSAADRSSTAGAARPSTRWRVVDIVVLAVLAAAGAVIFWAWSNALYPVVSGATVGYPPLSGLILGGWLLPGVIGGLVIRKPGAALACELLAAVLEGFLGTHFGWTVIISGIIQGLGAELGFALLRYRRWGAGAAVLAGALSALFGTVSENILYNFEWELAHRVAYTGFGVVSGIVIAGLLSWVLVNALRATGVLDALPSGRTVRRR